MNPRVYLRFCWSLLWVVITLYGCSDRGLASDVEPSNSQVAQATATSVNYASQAIVTAESTYPDYSVFRIIDGNRNTTVGPSYSWANNFPAGGKLPESVSLKFTSLKKIDRIDIYTSSGYELQNYTIQYRVTATGSWINLVVVSGNTSVFRSHTFSAVDLLEVQIICQLGPPNQTIYGRLNEVEIYGPPEPTPPYIQNENGILVFNSSNDVDQAIEYLEYKYGQYSDAFASQYPNLTADGFADVEEATGFNDDMPYIAFENQVGISSLRASLAAQEDYWLATTEGDETAGVDPDDLYVDDYEMRTLINANGYLKIGTIYYIFQDDGSYYTYDGGGGGTGGGCGSECTTQEIPTPLASIKSLKHGDSLPAGVKYFSPEPTVGIQLAAPGCRSNVKSKGFAYNSDRTWRFKWKVKSAEWPFADSGHVKAITKSYRKKNGKWKSRGAIIGADVYGDVVHLDCSIGQPVDSGYQETPKRRHKQKAKVSVSNFAVNNGELKGFHYHENVGSLSSALTW